ncbi:MAG: peptide chain release factor N(5)-glutamine methyltransferase [Oscillospiraceae bacterium]|nr:peptide chain release factor N(5)-glutamine methyltransferase [Oscillospiraceae bacterium]
MVDRFALARMLGDAGIPDAFFDAGCIEAQFPGEEDRLAAAKRRMAGEPLQYILGEWEFYGMRLFVGEGVLIPRPDTETLIDTLLPLCKGRRGLRVVDLCTGSGCIALSLAKHLDGALVTGLDLSVQALSYARRNSDYHALPVSWQEADVCDRAAAAQFSGVDVLVSNPPYLTAQEMTVLQREVTYEPACALFGGEDGLVFYRTVTQLWTPCLAPGGILAYEIGETQGKAVEAILNAHGYTGVRTVHDLAGQPRVVYGMRPPGSDYIAPGISPAGGST